MVKLLVEILGTVGIAGCFAILAIYSIFFWLWPINDKEPGIFHWTGLVLTVSGLAVLLFKVI